MSLHLPCEIYMRIFDFLDIETQLSFLHVFPFLSEYVFLDSNFNSDDNEITKYNRYKLYKCSNINKLHDNINIKELHEQLCFQLHSIAIDYIWSNSSNETMFDLRNQVRNALT